METVQRTEDLNSCRHAGSTRGSVAPTVERSSGLQVGAAGLHRGQALGCPCTPLEPIRWIRSTPPALLQRTRSNSQDGATALLATATKTAEQNKTKTKMKPHPVKLPGRGLLGGHLERNSRRLNLPQLAPAGRGRGRGRWAQRVSQARGAGALGRKRRCNGNANQTRVARARCWEQRGDT